MANPHFDRVEIDQEIRKKLIEFAYYVDKNTRKLSEANCGKLLLSESKTDNQLPEALHHLTINLREQAKIAKE